MPFWLPCLLRGYKDRRCVRLEKGNNENFKDVKQTLPFIIEFHLILFNPNIQNCGPVVDFLSSFSILVVRLSI